MAASHQRWSLNRNSPHTKDSLVSRGVQQSWEQWVVQYNLINHTIFLIGLTAACSWLIWAAHRSDQRNIQAKNKSGLTKRFTHGIKKYPFVTGLFSFYTILMVQHTSWFYKEIIGWYKDIIGSHLLNNFALRWEITKETMLRNDFRFYPLAHQDLHILSWFTPYVKVWMLVNAAELFLIVILGAKIVEALSERENRPGISTNVQHSFYLMPPLAIHSSNSSTARDLSFYFLPCTHSTIVDTSKMQITAMHI